MSKCHFQCKRNTNQQERNERMGAEKYKKKKKKEKT